MSTGSPRDAVSGGQWPLVIGLAVVLAAAACSSSGSDDPTTTDTDTDTDTSSTDAPETSDPTTTTSTTVAAPVVAMAEVTGPITSDSGPVVPQPAVALPDGYVEEEFFVGGEATRYETIGDAGTDGFWNAEAADTAAYRTRILVRRPPPGAFSGVVIVEWLNVTAVEASPDWGYLSEEIGRAGHAYVAASAQALGVVGGEGLLEVEIDEEAAAEAGAEGQQVDTGGLISIDPDRYGTLTHPGDAFAYDIFSQIGAALTTGADTVLGGLGPTSIIAAGESQSAGFLSTYVNAVHQLAGVYDGFLVHSRGAGAAPFDGGFAREAESNEEGSSFVEDAVLIRTDLDEPVFILQTETDMTLLGYTHARQPDTDSVNTWEVAGTAHSDSHVFRAILGGPRDPSVGSLIGCDLINSGPHHEAAQAALHHLVAWSEGGPPPPAGARLEIVEGDTPAIARDELGMAIGGVRNPLVDVPVAVVNGDPPTGLSLDSVEGFDICGLFGQTFPLDQSALVELHGSADDYVAAFRASAEAAVEAGFLLQADADQLIEEAEANRALFG